MKKPSPRIATAVLLLRGALVLAGLFIALPQAQAQAVYQGDTQPATPPPAGLAAQAIIGESGYYSSNPLLEVNGGKPLWGSITSPEMVLTDQTPLTNFTSDTVFDSNNFNQSDFNSNDVHSKLKLNEQLERWGAGLQGNIDYDTTRTSELSNYNLNAAPVRHLGGTITPDITYNVLPTDQLGLQGSYSQSHYDGDIFASYRVYSITPSYTHEFDPLDKGIFSLQAQRYTTTTGVSDTVDTYGPQIGWQRKFTEKLDGSISVGLQEMKQSEAGLPGGAAWKPEYDYAGALNYTDTQDKLSFNASRSEYPFGNGTEAFLTQVSLNETHAINERLSLGLGGSYQSADYDQNAAGNLDSLITGTGSLTYHVTDQVDLGLTYQYRDESLVGFSNDVHDHMGLLSVSYRPKAWTL